MSSTVYSPFAFLGEVEVIKIVSAKPENMDKELLAGCGFDSIEKAKEYVEREHGEEFKRDGVMTVFVYRVLERK